MATLALNGLNKNVLPKPDWNKIFSDQSVKMSLTL